PRGTPMPTPLIECIPNFSDARRPEVIAAISQSIANVEGVHVLDQHSDNDHNRTVITFVGSPAGVEEAAFQSIAKAAALIDLNEHTGAHPRIGATDVFPFVPISGVTMQECVDIAKRVGQRVADELGIPVYLYEEAASSPARRNLEGHRKGQYKTLKDVIATDPERAPDFGPKKLGPAGATVIGAREFLIAYNVYLTTDDVSIAKKIARAVRHSSGGLRYVKGLGLLVDGQAQVSMNLTNFRKTPLARVVEFIRREAERYGVGIHHSELVGLIPQDALVDAAVWYTQMDQFEPEQVLEGKLYSVLKNTPPDDRRPTTDRGPRSVVGGRFLDALASGEPTPGGGSAAAYAGAMGAGLVAMVARLSIGKKKYTQVEAQMRALLDEAETLRSELAAAVGADSAAFESVMAAFKRPKDDPARPEAIQRATLHAAQVPLNVARKSVRVFELAVQAAELGNINAITDAGSGAALAQASLSSAGYNVNINALSLKDEDTARSLLDELAKLDNQTVILTQQLRGILHHRGGLELMESIERG
ncbi:MAG: glutamate formimidoyltransferase, partial [Chloroflexota bacterium]